MRLYEGICIEQRFVKYIVSKVKDEMWERIENSVSEHEAISAEEGATRMR